MAQPLALVQHRNNLATASGWELFASHRARLTALVGQEARGGALLVLGAGNANDLDLAALAPEFQRVHLADLDPAALNRARARLRDEARSRVQLHAPVELTGALPRLARWRGKHVAAAVLADLPVSAAEQVVSTLAAGPFDLVVSACLLSQILHACGRTLGTDHPQLREVAGALVAAHLRTLARLTRPGGTIILATDVVSSETYPLQERWDQQPPRVLLNELVRTGNVFTGADPRFVGRILAAHPQVAPLVSSVEVVDPWLWTMSDDLTVMVYAMRFTAVSAARV